MYVYGKNVAKELINNKREIKKAYLLNTFMNSDLESLLKNAKVNIDYMDKSRWKSPRCSFRNRWL